MQPRLTTNWQVERGFSAFLKGTFVKPPLFAHEHHWRALQVFLTHIDCISERRWGVVLGFENDGDDSDDSDDVDEAMISAYRGGLYIASSPQKA
jgi:hypothetical protein